MNPFADTRIISLPGSPHRFHTSRDLLELAGIRPRLFRATDGRRGIDPSRVDALNPDYVELMRRRKGYDTDAFLGMLGCLTSHARLWREQVSRNIPVLAVFEDDLDIDPETFVPEVERLVSEMPQDWGLLALGARFPRKPFPYSRRLVVPATVHGTHAYLIRPPAARFLLRETLPASMPVDWHWNSYFWFGRGFAANPTLAGQRYNRSSIDGQTGVRVKRNQLVETRQSFHPYRPPREVVT